MTAHNPFLLSIISDEISQDPDIAIALARQYAFDGIELRSIWNKQVDLLPEQSLKGVVVSAAQAGLAISSISSSFLKEDWGVDDTEKYERIARACHICGCNSFRAFSFWKTAQYSDERFADYLAAYDQKLEADGLHMTIENDPSVNISTGKELARFFRRHSFRNIGVLWDPGNDIYTLGEQAAPFPQYYEELKDYVCHVHVKDAVVKDGDPVGVALGEGLMDFAGQFRALKRDGYSGWVTLEPHYRLEGTIDKELLKRPGGAAFSENGYLPSKICMENLRNLMKQLIEDDGATE